MTEQTQTAYTLTMMDNNVIRYECPQLGITAFNYPVSDDKSPSLVYFGKGQMTSQYLVVGFCSKCKSGYELDKSRKNICKNCHKHEINRQSIQILPLENRRSEYFFMFEGNKITAFVADGNQLFLRELETFSIGFKGKQKVYNELFSSKAAFDAYLPNIPKTFADLLPNFKTLADYSVVKGFVKKNDDASLIALGLNTLKADISIDTIKLIKHFDAQTLTLIENKHLVNPLTAAKQMTLFDMEEIRELLESPYFKEKSLPNIISVYGRIDESKGRVTANLSSLMNFVDDNDLLPFLYKFIEEGNGEIPVTSEDLKTAVENIKPDLSIFKKVCLKDEQELLELLNENKSSTGIYVYPFSMINEKEFSCSSVLKAIYRELISKKSNENNYVLIRCSINEDSCLALLNRNISVSSFIKFTPSNSFSHIAELNEAIDTYRKTIFAYSLLSMD